MLLKPIHKSFMQQMVEEVYSARWNRPVTIEEILKKLYIDEQKSVRDIAKEVHVSFPTISKWLNDYGIDTRKIKWL